MTDVLVHLENKARATEYITGRAYPLKMLDFLVLWFFLQRGGNK